MPRYLVERSFPDGLAIPVNEGGAKACQVVVDGNAAEGVTWVHSYVTPDKYLRRPAAVSVAEVAWDEWPRCMGRRSALRAATRRARALPLAGQRR